MGLFSSKKVVYVASVGYNMAGPVTDRLSVLKSTVSRHILLGEKKIDLAVRITETQMRGPTMNQRSWFRWAKTNYTLGQVSGRLSNRNEIEEAVVAPYITIPAGYELMLDDAFFDSANISYFAEQYILLNRPDDIESAWIADYTVATGQMVIQFEDLSSVTVSVAGFVQSAVYLVAAYRQKVIGADDTTAVPLMFIYKVGTGIPTLDALNVVAPPQPEFFPAIPLRIENTSIADAIYDAQFPGIAKAYKKATGESIDTILASIADNENIADVDYATLVFGVELTTQEKCGLRYLYEFFQDLIPLQTTSIGAFEAYKTAVALNPSLFRRVPPTTTLRVNGTDSFMAHNDVRLSWVTIDERIEGGLGKVGAVTGDMWFEDKSSIIVPGVVIRVSGTNKVFGGYNLPHSQLFWQISATTYKVLDIYGMVHQNFVYGGKSVELTTSQALTGEDGEGFIVPLHYPTLIKLPLLLSNQLALSSRHVVFNCYNIVKIRWYQRGIFKILFSVVIAIVSAFIFPGFSGLLGTALSVGTYLGFTGITAVIVGAAVNALAAMVLLAVIEKASVAIFGEAWGRLLSSVISFFAFQYVSNLAAGLSYSIDWGQLMQMDKMMGLLNSAVSGVSGWLQGEFAGIQEDMSNLGEKYKSDMDKLEKQAMDLLGAGGGVIDPLMFTQAQDRFLAKESRDAFLQRTLMTGSDLIDLSMSMIEDYADLNLTVDIENV